MGDQGVPADDSALLAALREGDEAAFSSLYAKLTPALTRVARGYAPSAAVADEIVAEAWLGVVRGIDSFEGRSSLKTWIFRIVLNVARTRSERESRTIPFSSAAPRPVDGEDVVDPDRFLEQNHERWPGHWRLGPADWALPDERLLTGETRSVIIAAVDRLSGSQREVITLRDIGGWSSSDVCNALGISEVNQRVLLHRARAKVRSAIERELGAIEET